MIIQSNYLRSDEPSVSALPPYSSRIIHIVLSYLVQSYPYSSAAAAIIARLRIAIAILTNSCISGHAT